MQETVKFVFRASIAISRPRASVGAVVLFASLLLTGCGSGEQSHRPSRITQKPAPPKTADSPKTPNEQPKISPVAAVEKKKPFPQNRLRDFYGDQAKSFLKRGGPLPDLLPAFPGLDGGAFGHWGQYAESSSSDDSWNRMDLGGLIGAVTSHFGAATNKAINIQLGDSLSALFDPDRCSFTDLWQGKLVSFQPNRYGLLNPAVPRGPQLVNLHESAWQLPAQTTKRYLGLYRNGQRVVLHYQIGEAKILDHPWEAAGNFARSLHVDGPIPAGTSLALLETTQADVTIEKSASLQVARIPQGDRVLLIELRAPQDAVKLAVAKHGEQSVVVIEFAEGEIAGPVHTAIARVDPEQADAVLKQFAAVAPPDLKQLITGGPPRWSQHSVTTHGVLGNADGAYAIDTLTIPYRGQNPFGTPFRVTGFDFLPDGRCVVATLTGDVWLVDGIDENLDRLVWKRFAAGLHQPLGVLVQDGKILVTGRDQITRLHDLNGDDEADFYECVTNDFQTAAGHNFVTCLQRDAQGSLYWSSAVQGILKFDAASQSVQTLGSGLRYTDGLAVSPDGDVVLATVQEGTWTPTSAIFEVGGGSYHGLGGPRKGVGKYGYDLPLCFIPRGVDHSSGGLAFLPNDDRLGPLAGNIIGLSIGNCTHYLVLRETVGDTVQGGVVPLPGDFLSGAHRARFNSHDGHLYVAGTAAWQSYAAESGSLQRLRHTGKTLNLPTAIETHENGLLVRFNCRIDRRSVDVRNVFCEQWNYLYSGGYGSAEYSVRNPGRQGHDPVKVRSIHLLDDGQSVFVEIPQLHPVMQLHLHLKLSAVSAEPDSPMSVSPDIYYSIYELDAPFTRFDGYAKIAKRRYPDFPVAAKYPRDPRLVAQEERAFDYGKLQNVIPVEVRAVPGLRYEPRRLRIPPGKRIALTFKNTDVNMQHNFVLVQQDRLDAIGEASMLLAADPRAIATHYVPDDPGVMYLSPILDPGDQYTIYFDSPEKTGAYPFVCTFPGHWKVMRGMLYVANEGDTLPEESEQPARKFVKMWKTEDLAAEAETLTGRSFVQGREMFQVAGCHKCHVIAGKGTKLGPDLTEVSRQYKGAKLLQQILEPSSEIHKEFQTVLVTTTSGETITGLILKETPDSYQILPNPLKPDEVKAVKKQDVDEMQPSKRSTMPEGLLMTLEKDEILDLLSFIQSGGNPQHALFAR